MKLAALAGDRGLTVTRPPVRRSLVVWDDAGREAMPDLLRDVSWDALTAFFQSESLRLCG
jgi:hypothetical protein